MSCTVHGSRGLCCRHLVQLLSVEDERHPAISENRRRGDTRNRAIALFDALNNNLLVSAQLVYPQAEPNVFAGFGNDHDTAIIPLGGSDIEQIAKIDDGQ